jgi:hypothetical protein
MATTSHRAMRRVVCRIFIKATPEAVWDAICPALRQSGRYVSPAGSGAGPTAAPPGDHVASARYLSELIAIGDVLEADPPGRLVHALDAAGRSASIRSSHLSVELRDTLTGYTALTVRCEPEAAPGVLVPGTAGAFEWDRLLADLKAGLEGGLEGGRDGRQSGPAPSSSSPRRPSRLRPKLTPQPQALSGRRLSPAGPVRASPRSAVRMSWHRPLAAPGEGKPAAGQCSERGDGDSDSGDRGAGIRGGRESAGNSAP